MFGSANKNKKRKIVVPSENSRVISSKKTARQRHPDSSVGKTIGKILYAILVAVFFATIIYALFFSRLLAVTQMNVSGTDKLNSNDLKKFVSADISGKYLKLLNRNNMLFISADKIGRDLAGRFGQIESVSVKKIFPNKIFISIAERKSMLVLCSGGNCYVVDENGNTFSKVDPNSHEIQQSGLPVLTDDSGKAISFDEGVLNPDYMQFIIDAKDRLKGDLDVSVGEIHTPQIASGDIRMMTAGGWKIYFDQTVGLQKEMDMLKAVLNNEIDKSKWSDLDYVDLRIDGKVYYKFKNDNSDQQSSQQNQNSNPQQTSSKKN